MPSVLALLAIYLTVHSSIVLATGGWGGVAQGAKAGRGLLMEAMRHTHACWPGLQQAA